MWSRGTPLIVAEALEPVRFPVDTVLRPGKPRSPAEVAVGMAAVLEPEEATCPIPPWLRPGQGRALRRLIHAVAYFRGALLADPVGSGKTYVALAAAAVCNGSSPTYCIIPPALSAQWLETAQRLEVVIIPWSEALLSRGHVPPAGSGLVVIDESHHFRNPATKRYQHLAPWISGRPVLMLSATPVVNRADDLVHQLNLAVRDDALAAYGLGTLYDGIRGGDPHPALGKLVFLSPLEQRPRRPDTVESEWRPPTDYPETTDTFIEDLALAADGQTAALLRGVFWRALASSPAALRVVAVRYRRLLEHARDAIAEGRHMGRSALKALTAECPDQLLMWSLFEEASSDDVLPLGDLDILQAILQRLDDTEPGDDPKLRRLQALATDTRRTLVFTGFRATVHYLTKHLTGFTVAWCTGSSAGIGGLRTTRAEALHAFGGREPIRPTQGSRPALLIATDVLAEGLDIQAAERVVHYDLPWNEVRIEQRNGRAVRAGSRHARVQIVRFQPTPSLEARLSILATLRHKSRVAEQLGLGPGRRDQWRWRAGLAAAMGQGQLPGGTAGLAIKPAGVLAAVRVHGSRALQPGLRGPAISRHAWLPGPLALLTTIVWIDPDGSWTEDALVITDRIERAILATSGIALTSSDIAAGVRKVGPVARELMHRLQRGRWTGVSPHPGRRALVAAMRGQAVDAARRRDGGALKRLDDILAFLAGGHTAGERSLIANLQQSGQRLSDRIPLPKADPPNRPLDLELAGLIIFKP